VETTPAYPDICFAIDDFDSTFDAVVINHFSKFYVFNYTFMYEMFILIQHMLWFTFSS